MLGCQCVAAECLGICGHRQMLCFCKGCLLKRMKQQVQARGPNPWQAIKPLAPKLRCKDERDTFWKC